MAFLCGKNPGNDDDETEIDEQPTAPWPLPAATVTEDPEAFIETQPKLPIVDLALMEARRAYLRQEKLLEPFCPVCERFGVVGSVEHDLGPAEKTDKLRPRLCPEHATRAKETQPMSENILRHSMEWYFRPDDHDAD